MQHGQVFDYYSEAAELLEIQTLTRSATRLHWPASSTPVAELPRSLDSDA